MNTTMNPTDNTTEQSDTTNPGYTTVLLDTPFQRGELLISTIQLRKPKAGELRGVSLVELANLDVVALQKVLPRITTPALTANEVNNLDIADLTQLGSEAAHFLARKAVRNGDFRTA